MEINNEDFFQISTDILSSFPKHRLPLDFYVFRDDIAVLEPYYKKGSRLSDEQAAELAKICADGNLFVSHRDQDVYRQHIELQLDLVLLDPHLKDFEIAETCIKALYRRFMRFYDQPVPEVMDLLYRDVMVVTEYLWTDKFHITPFIRRLFRKADPGRHALNSMIVGTWLWMQLYKEYTRKELDRIVWGMLIHDIGMNKTPQFIVAKKGRLKQEEMDKVMQHPFHSVKILQKCDASNEDLVRACFEHHERLDGSGYPQRSKGTQISTIGKLVALADSFSAMICERCYAPAKDPERAGVELYEDARYDRSMAAPLSTAFVQGGPLGTLIAMDEKLDAQAK